MSILTKLNLPYRLVELCTEILVFHHLIQLIAIWMPGQKYREVSSCSNCKDFQSRRMKMRVRDKQTGETFFPHTLNASSIAIGRILISIIENFQQSNGSILVPEALRPYMSATKIIGNLREKKNNDKLDLLLIKKSGITNIDILNLIEETDRSLFVDENLIEKSN